MIIKAEWTNKDSLDLQPTCNQLATTAEDLISRQGAIKRFGEDGTWLERQGVTALTMVEAKQRAVDILESLPSANAVEAVMCKDCKHYLNEHICMYFSRHGTIETSSDAYCSYGERREP